jgi:OmpA-OmpF porin, OOP family
LITNKKAFLGALVATLMLATPALSFAQQRLVQPPDPRGWYFGGMIGNARFDRGCEASLLSCDNSDRAWKIYGGFQFNRNLMLEGGYSDLGAADGNGTIGGMPANFQREVTAIDFSMLLGGRPWDRVGLYGRLGFKRSDTHVRGAVVGTSVDVREKGGALTYGVTGEYSFTDNFALRAEWQRFRNTGGPALEPFFSRSFEDDIDAVTIGFRVRF